MDSGSPRSKVPAFLSDLGKATLRGIRKCPRCGTYNGTRGLSCKNKTCGTVFRYGSRKPAGVDAVKIITGSDLQVYSVRQRDRGPEYRCFVELGVSETTIQTVDGTLLTQLSSGRCYLPACLKAASQGVAENRCQHLKLAVGCQAEATPLTLKSSVLNAMQASPQTKQALWELATQPTGPLVQRVTKNVLVVKGKASPKHGLGYLHITFAPRSGHKGPAGPRFFCPCQSLRASKAAQEGGHKCIHFFACLCAFASDEALAEEFGEFLSSEPGGLIPPARSPLACQPASPLPSGDLVASKAKRKKKDEGPGMPASSTPLSQDLASSSLQKNGLKKAAVASLKRQSGTQVLEESQVALSFLEWLASVTERIHQAMHYQFDGKPEPLVFHIPQTFFEALQQRIGLGSIKMRLPNSTTAFVRKDALPLGTFSKYTWHITNILQVKQIFDTLEMPLEITRSFIQNRDGTYEPFRCPKVEVESIAETYGRLEKQPVLRPLELKTFLKVGNTSPDQKEPTPFIIEWIPDILPLSKIGELRIKFEYGHYRNGHPANYQEQRPSLEQQALEILTFP
uniref:Chromosome 2 open reading frame 42 n=1 Tax=Laticauda laticaudata TaxID=8630 RepID=A0A8C5RSL5_LATLA